MFREASILAVLVAVCLFFSAVTPEFATWSNARVILRASAYTGIMAVGVGFLLISGMIDISIGRIAGLGAIVAAYLMAHGLGVVLACFLGLVAGALVGLLNSILVLRFRLPAFLATIATMFACQGLSSSLANGFSIYPLPPVIGAFGSAQPLGLSYALFIFLALALIGDFILRGTVYGLMVKATGSDREIAFMTEVPVRKISTSTFVICGTLAALAGILIMARIATGDSGIGAGYELNAITAAAIGGVSLFGYDGSMIGVVIGTLLIQVLTNGLVQMGMNPYLQLTIIGCILIITAYVDQRQRERLRL